MGPVMGPAGIGTPGPLGTSYGAVPTATSSDDVPATEATGAT